MGDMRLLSLKETSCRETDVVFRNSWVASAVATVVMWALAVAAGYLVVEGRIGSFGPPRAISVVSGLFFMLFASLAGGTWKAARQPTNWLMRIRGNEVLIKFRSYQNWRLPEDETQVIELERSEIASVRELGQRQVSREKGGGGVVVEKRIDLEIELRDKDTAVLEKALAAEIARPGWGSERTKTKTLDYPVSVEKAAIRIAWKNRSTNVRPGIQSALKQLGEIADVMNPSKQVDDFTPAALEKLGEEEQRAKLRELARRDSMAAVEAARKLYGCSLEEASKIVEGLNLGEAREDVGEGMR
jgi:hypothetical protein